MYCSGICWTTTDKEVKIQLRKDFKEVQNELIRVVLYLGQYATKIYD